MGEGPVDSPMLEAREEKKKYFTLFGFVFALFIFSLFMITPAHALSPGKYSDYVWASDYHPPAAPANMNLNCSFFLPDDPVCADINALDNESRDAVLLAAIGRTSPEEYQDWVRYWNGQLPIKDYYDNLSAINETADGAYGENNSLRDMWFRLIDFYPAVYDQRDGYYYLSDQTLVLSPFHVNFVVPNSMEGDWCAQSYDIKGYDVELRKSIGNFSTTGSILPVSQLMAPGEKANLTLTMSATGAYSYNLSASRNASCGNCTQECVFNATRSSADTLTLSHEYPIKRFPDTFEYNNTLSVPKTGFAQGLVSLRLPADFLYYQFSVKGYTYTVSRHELQLQSYGGVYPLLRLALIPSPSQSGTLHITSSSQNDDNITYWADLHYKLPVSAPDIGETDCAFTLVTPFGTKTVERACTTARAESSIKLEVLRVENGIGTIQASVHDQLGNPLEGSVVQFTSGGLVLNKTTDANGIALAQLPQGQSTSSVEGAVVDSENASGAKAIIFLAGKSGTTGKGASFLSAVVGAAPILLIVLLVSSSMMWLLRKRSSAWLVLLLCLALLPAMAWGQDAGANNTTQITQDSSGGVLDVQATLDACRGYDFSNAVRHFGECAEAYQLSNEFSSMRRTATKLIENIGPLVVATPDITAYKQPYSDMVRISLALFRVAWAFNSLYLLLNIFNPNRRNEALKQYIWLIVFVIFAYFSFTLISGAVSAVNNVAEWVAGKDAAASLTQATLSAEFVSENYEMLKLVLPFLSVTYLVLLARNITVIAMILFFPFSLLLFFTSATKGFGRAALTVTFAALGLGVVNAILLLIYNILVTTAADPTLSGSFAATFFSASFIIFFGFVNLLVLAVAFLSGIVFIGQSRGAEG